MLSNDKLVIQSCLNQKIKNKNKAY